MPNDPVTDPEHNDWTQPKKPDWQLIDVSCGCGHQWQEWLPVFVPIDRYTAWLKMIWCTQCGTKNDIWFMDPLRDVDPRP